MSDYILDTKVGIVGLGAMGSAIAEGLIEAGVVDHANIYGCDHNASKRDALCHAINVFETAGEVLAQELDVVILCIKPQVLGAFMAANVKALAGKLVVSIAAGVNLKTLESALPSSRVVRVMPNLTLARLCGASAVCKGASATEADLELVHTMFDALGCAFVMREDQLDAEGAVVGCGPAYFALMVDALTRAGVRAGMTAASARKMTIATMKGVALMLEEDKSQHPREFMERVTSPGGTTAAALYELEPALCDGVYAAVDAAIERSHELAGE